MKTYKNNFGFLAFSMEGKDHVTDKGDTLQLPEDNSLTRSLVASETIKEVEPNVKPSKTQK